MTSVLADFADGTTAPKVLAKVTSIDSDKRLPRADAAELAKCERVIERGLRAYVDTGAALQQIRDRKLYREHHRTFPDYLRDRWDMSPSRAYQYIEASDIVRRTSTIVEESALPATESQARELVGLEPEQAAMVLRRAPRPRGKLTARAIEQARKLVEVQAKLSEPAVGLGLGAHVGPKPLAAVDTAPTAGDVAADEQVVGEAITDTRRDAIKVTRPDNVEEWIDVRYLTVFPCEEYIADLDEVASDAVALRAGVMAVHERWLGLPMDTYNENTKGIGSYIATQIDCLQDNIAETQRLLSELRQAAKGYWVS